MKLMDFYEYSHIYLGRKVPLLMRISDILLVKNHHKGLFIDMAHSPNDVYNHFVAAFPYLKISFFNNGSELLQKHTDTPIWRLASESNLNSFTIDENMTVTQVVNLFKNQLGLKVVIFRKLGQNLVETTFTSKWTLGHQNKVGSKVYFESEER